MTGGGAEPPESLGRASTPEGGRIELVRHPTRTVIYVDDLLLMSTDAHGSEVAMADVGCGMFAPRARVLVGGLGLGFTLRAVLDTVPADDAEVICVELLEPLVRWHRDGPLGAITDHPLRDRRVTVRSADVVEVLRESDEASFDAILLDVDNGPIAMTQNDNARLYGDEGLRRIHRLLRPGGHLVVWSADDFPAFTARMAAAGFEAHAQRVSAWAPDETPKSDVTHVLFVGVRPG